MLFLPSLSVFFTRKFLLQFLVWPLELEVYGGLFYSLNHRYFAVQLRTLSLCQLLQPDMLPFFGHVNNNFQLRQQVLVAIYSDDSLSTAHSCMHWRKEGACKWHMFSNTVLDVTIYQHSPYPIVVFCLMGGLGCSPKHQKVISSRKCLVAARHLLQDKLQLSGYS